MQPLTDKDITAVILAGGKGSRLGGQDKGLVSYKGRPLIEHVLDGISDQTPNILISANRNLNTYAGYGYPVVQDTLDDYQGPLAGILASMSFAQTPYILTLPCDGPFVDGGYLEKMLGRKNLGQADIVVASNGLYPQPVYALIPVTLQQSLRDYIDKGERKTIGWYQQHRVVEVEFSDQAGFFTNLNLPQDLGRQG
jgi:molybdenum cofactor guanylyltransferase